VGCLLVVVCFVVVCCGCRFFDGDLVMVIVGVCGIFDVLC